MYLNPMRSYSEGITVNRIKERLIATAYWLNFSKWNQSSAELKLKYTALEAANLALIDANKKLDFQKWRERKKSGRVRNR